MTLSIENFIERARKCHGDKYDYSSVTYSSTKKKVKIICLEHGSFWQTPNDHMKGRGCPLCAIKRISESLSLSREQFIERAIVVHGNRYDYSLSKYVKTGVKISITCSVHGAFEQDPSIHLQGSGCPECANSLRAKNMTKSLELFIDEAALVHNDKFDYSKVVYVESHTKIEIICPLHGSFFQQPCLHLRGTGCLLCHIDDKTKTTSEFIDEANEVHNGKYSYRFVEYENTLLKVKIECLSHGTFMQTPDAHLQGQGCPRCVYAVSKSEILWLDAIGVSSDFRHKTLRIGERNYMVDAFDPNTNTVYEFYGDYWHGNPVRFAADKINGTNKKVFGELYAATLQRESAIRLAGYNLVTIWESNWKKLKNNAS
jgi:hypothetical protein